MNPKISVIIPVYNVEEYLREALDSVINQTLKDIEIICIDDYSTDNSLSVLKEYASKDSRIKVFKQEVNRGQGPARNRALDIAKGEIIMFLDPDDWYTLDACEKVYNQLTKNKNDFLYMNYCFCNETKGERVYKNGENHLDCLFEYADCPNIKLWELKNNFWYNVNTVCRAYKREFLEKYHIRYDETIRLCEDVPFFAKCIANAQSVSIILDELYTIRNRAGSTSKTASIYEDVIISRKKAYDIIKNSQHAEGLKIPCLCYALTVLSHFYNLTKIDRKIEKDFYNKIRKFFIFLNENEDIESIKDHTQHYYAYKMILKNSYRIYKFNKFVQSIYSNKVVFDRGYERKIIKFLGISYKTIVNSKVSNKNKDIIIDRIRNKIKNNKKINVIFISNEISKWGYSDLYNKFKESKYFNPKIIVLPLLRVHNNKDNTQPDLKTQYDFYKKQGFDVEFAYNTEKKFYRSLRRYCPDIVFYQQHWGLPPKFNIMNASRYALPFYTSYSFDVIDDKLHYTKEFHQLLQTFFVDTELNLKTYASYNTKALNNCLVVGYPKLDEYINNTPLDYKKYWKEPDKFKIIYAPHHSIEKDSLNLATFLENGQFILELAKSHPETTWVFKPHPRLAFALLKNKIMTEEELKKYYQDWKEIGNICESGNYIDLFKTSDLMITDCGSFLGEYLPSGKPLIQLVNPKANFNKMGKKVKSEYYFSHNNEELQQLFDEIVIKKNDYKKEARKKLTDEIFDFSKSASDRIYEHIEKLVLNS